MGLLKHDEKLQGVEGALTDAIKLGVSRVSFDCVVSEDLRSTEKMKINWGMGRTAA